MIIIKYKICILLICILLIIIVILIIEGCSATPQALSPPEVQPQAYTSKIALYKEIADLVQESVKMEYGITPDSYKIEQIQNKEELTFITFSLKNKQDNYRGILVANKNGEKYGLLTIDMRLINNRNLIDVSIITGHASEKIGYMAVTGNFNPEIQTISIQYPNGQFNVLKLDSNQDIYMDVTIGYQEQPSQIFGFDKTNNLLFTWK